MVYIMLSEDESIIKREIIEFVKHIIKFNNFNYRIIYNKKHIIDSDIIFIDTSKDILLWEPIVANNNLELVKTFQNSIVILQRPSIFVQKISKFNPFNENMAINHGLYLIYINPNESDITNDEWKHVVKEEMYLMTHERLINLITEDEKNIKQEKIDVPDVFDEIVNLVKNQINLS